MPLSFKPEPTNRLRARFQAALYETFDAESIELGVAVLPGQRRANTFDFECGIRLVVSRIRHVSGRDRVHMTAARCMIGAIGCCEHPASVQAFLRNAMQCYVDVSGQQPLEFVGVMDGGVPCWCEPVQLTLKDKLVEMLTEQRS